MHACILHLYTITCACSIDGWPYEESASHSQTCRVFAHRQRPHAIARVRKNTHPYPFTYPDLASMNIDTYMLYMTCALATYTSGRTHARK
jgi:hypothetical protein